MTTFQEVREHPIKLFFGKGNWSIHTGESEFMVVEGAEWSTDLGQEIFQTFAGDRAIFKFKDKWVVK